MDIGLRIKERRKDLKMSAEDLGERLGKDRSTIYRYEKGDIENLPLDLLEPIAVALDTTPAYLMGWENEKEKPAPEDEFSDNIRTLIEFVKSVPEDKADLILRVMKSIVEDDL